MIYFINIKTAGGSEKVKTLDLYPEAYSRAVWLNDPAVSTLENTESNLKFTTLDICGDGEHF